jgi:hypothetical protein
MLIFFGEKNADEGSYQVHRKTIWWMMEFIEANV